MKKVTRALVTALLAALLIAPAAASATGRQVALGISSIDDKSLGALDANIATVGHKPALWSVWSAWGGSDSAFPTDLMNGLRSRGVVPLVIWSPIDPNSQYDCSRWSLDNIIGGDHDTYIREWATAAKNFGGTVILRFAHEMNGSWFQWGYSRCTNTPAKFRQAWQHVWNIFRGPGGVGAGNVKFLWSIYGAFKLRGHYPGDAYVDYVGLTAFNWGPTGNNPQPWRTMVQNFKSSMKALRRVTRKPVIAAEMGASDAPNCSTCDKAQYVATGYPKVYAKWPQIVAFVYFDIDMTFVNQPNWRLDSPSGALNAYRQIAADPRFQGSIP